MIDSVYISYFYPFNRFWGIAGAFITFGIYAGANLILVVISIKLFKRIKRRRIKSTE
jgi:hypothetical protein